MTKSKLHLFIFIDSYGYELFKKYGPVNQRDKSK